jgi:hypothetical protein
MKRFFFVVYGRLNRNRWPIDCVGEFIGFTPLSTNLAEGGIKILLPKTIASKP